MAPSVAHDGTVDLDASAGAHEGVVTARIGAGMGKGKVAVAASTHLDRGKPRGLRLHGTLQRVDPSFLSSAASKGSINGTVDADLQGPLDSATGTARRSGNRLAHRHDSCSSGWTFTLSSPAGEPT